MNKYIKFTGIVVLMLLARIGVAQRMPITYNIYHQNKFLFNPANTLDEARGFADYKRQAAGVKGGQTLMTAGLHSVIGTQKTSAIGLLVNHSEFGIYGNLSATANYAYLVRLNEKHHLGLGLGLGIIDRRIDSELSNTEATFKQEEDGMEKSYLNGRFGLNYSWDKRLNVGFSMPEFLTSDYGFNQHFLANASFKFYDAKQKWEIEPSVLFRHYKFDGSSNQFDLGLYTCWSSQIYVQAGYRMNMKNKADGLNSKVNGLVAGAGLYVANLGIGYAYERNFGSVPTPLKATHEVQVTLYFNKDRIKNKNEELLNDNQLELLVDSAPQEENKDEYYNNQIDSLKKALNDMNNMLKLKELADFTDALMEKIRKLDEQQMEAIKNLKDPVVFFDVNKYNIKSEYFAELDKFADVVKAGNIKVEVQGYADEQGPADYNKVLAEKRANAVKDYLVSKGVSSSNLTLYAHGETTEFGTSLQSNRRVQFKR